MDATNAPVVGIEAITPAQAARMLADQHRNRNLTTKRVEKLAALILGGKWEPYASVIHIDDTARVINGQHRLAAIAKAGKTVHCMIVRGVPSTLQEVIDLDARERKASDVLTIRGLSSATGRAAVARYMRSVLLGTGSIWNDANTSSQGIIDTYNACEDDINWAFGIMGKKHRFLALTVATFALCRPFGEAALEDLASKVVTRNGRVPGDLAHMIEKADGSVHGGGHGESAFVGHMRRMLFALRKYLNGEPVRSFRDKPDGLEWIRAKHPLAIKKARKS